MKDGGIDGEPAEGVSEVNSSSNTNTTVIKWRFEKRGGWDWDWEFMDIIVFFDG